VRGDAALTARLLLFGQGRAGLVVAVGGTFAVIGSLLPWYELVTTVTMLGEQAERPAAVLRGVPDLVRGGWTLGLGVALVVLGVALGIDRPPPLARTAIGLAALATGGIAVAALLGRPSVATMSRQGDADLVALRDELPVGIELALSAEPAGGCWLVLAGAMIALGGAVASLRSVER
jgi:hypothetical protein